jgi:hypothetical protein
MWTVRHRFSSNGRSIERSSRYTSEEILGLAQRGNVLIRSWGAATLLRDLPQVISVRVCAPMSTRVRNAKLLTPTAVVGQNLKTSQ